MSRSASLLTSNTAFLSKVPDFNATLGLAALHVHIHAHVCAPWTLCDSAIKSA